MVTKAKMRSRLLGAIGGAGALLLAGINVANAAPAACRNTGNFDAWLAAFKKEAVAKGIPQRALFAAAPHMTFEQRIIHIDRGQKFFAQDFLQFSDKMLAGGRIPNGGKQVQRHAALFARAEKEFGVPAPVIVAFWGLESDFGAVQGKENSIRSITTLAYDCRRGDMFRAQLFDMLRLVDRGDLAPTEMIGSWAGELGQTQMMPTEYFHHAVDFDGDGRRDLIRSVPDVIASTANYIKHLGWRRGEPWLVEVRIPATLAWDQADLAIQHPRSQWARWGVTLANGTPLPSDALPASLLLPMGRKGPAFLAFNNFQVYLKWNNSLVYSTTAAYYATRIAGAPPVRRGSQDIERLSGDQVKELQTLLTRQGFDVGGADGKIGAGTRAAVKQVQLKLGLPADSYPTPELLERMKRGR